MAEGIEFQNIPGSGLVAPIFTAEVTSGGSYSTDMPAIIFGHKTTAGSLADNTPTICNSVIEAQALAGVGSMLADMYRLSARNAPAQEFWIVAVPATGTAAVWTLTAASVPVGTGVIEITGERLTVTIAAGDDDAAVAAAVAAAINGYYNRLTDAALPVTATAADAVVTVTARHAGTIYNDLDIYLPVLGFGQSNGFTATTLAKAQTVQGAGTPDVSSALAALADDNFIWQINPFSDTTNLDRFETSLSDVGGRWDWSRQSYGHAFQMITGTTSAITTIGAARNDRHGTGYYRISSCGDYNLSYQWVAALTARKLVWLGDGATGNCSRNMTGLVVEGLRAPRDRSVLPNYAARNAFLKSGISTWSVNSAGRVVIDKAITFYQKNPLDQPDETFRDIQAMAQIMHALTYFRARLSYEHGQKAIADENQSGLGSISTPNDVRASMIHIHEELVGRGILENTDEFARRLIVKRNVDNANRVDGHAPLDKVNPLDILAINARIYSQYRAA